MQLKASRLGEMLLEAGLIDQFQLDSALSLQRNLGGRIGSALIKLGYLPEETILEFLESQAKYTRVHLADLEIDKELFELLPLSRMEHLLVVPVALERSTKEKTLRVAMTDPTNLKLIDDLQFATGCRILPVFAAEKEIRQALQKHMERRTRPKAASASPGSLPDEDLLAGLATEDPRLDRLLDLLRQKGLLSKDEIEKVKSD